MMTEMGMIVDGIIFTIICIVVIWFFAYIVNTYLNKREIINRVKKEQEYEESQKLYCPHCGKLNRKEFVYCQYCGMRLH